VLPRPAWFALGVAGAAVAASYAPSGGSAVAAVSAAALPAVALAVAGVAARAAGGCRRRGAVPAAGGTARAGLGGRDRAAPQRTALIADGAVVAALGAAFVVARLTLGVALGGETQPPVALPAGTGPWQARVEAAHTSKGQQVATIVTSGGARAGSGEAAAAPPAAASPPIRCSALMPAAPRLVAGDTISWTGRIRPLGTSDYDAYLAGMGVTASCDATDLAVLSHDDSPGGRLEAFRQASGDALQRVLPEPEGGLAAAILIGLRDRVDRDVAAAFTTAGVSHIVAISGWNIAIVAASITALLRGFMTRRKRTAVIIVAIVAYTLFAGASASVLRAALMAGVAVTAVESGRASRVTVSLAWAAALMLLVEPATVADVGFQLSTAATAGLVAWGTPLTRLLERRLPRLPGALRESLGVSLAAQAATLPIVLLSFGRLALIAPAANLVAVPLVPPVMAAGLLAFVAGWLAVLGMPSWLGGLLAMPASMLLSALIAVVRVAASVPGANLTLGPPANLAAGALAVALLVPMHRRLMRAPPRDTRSTAAVGPAKRAGGAAGPPRLRWAVAGAALITILAGSVVAARPDGSVHVIVLDVGQGDAILVEGDLGGRILIDGGPDAGLLLSRLDRFIPTWDRRLDAIVLTHPHDDHVAGLVAVAERYQIGEAFESGWPADTPSYRAWKTALAARGVSLQRLSTGRTLALDDAVLRVLWPDDGSKRSEYLDATATENRKTNDASIVLLGEYENRLFLLTGDIEDDVDPVLMSRGLPAVDVLKVAHHGSATASSADLLAVLRPRVAAISVGADNKYGHPNAGTLARLRNVAQRVYRTDQDGSVDISLDRAGVTVTTSGASGPAATPTAPARGTALLYDPRDVRSQPSRERGLASIARAAGVVPAPFESRRRNRGLACVAGCRGRSSGRSPPRGIGRVAA